MGFKIKVKELGLYSKENVIPLKEWDTWRDQIYTLKINFKYGVGEWVEEEGMASGSINWLYLSNGMMRIFLIKMVLVEKDIKENIPEFLKKEICQNWVISYMGWNT